MYEVPDRVISNRVWAGIWRWACIFDSDRAWKLKFKMDAGVPFLLLGIQSAGKKGVGFTIDTDFFYNFFDSEGNLFFFFFFRTKTLWLGHDYHL